MAKKRIKVLAIINKSRNFATECNFIYYYFYLLITKKSKRLWLTQRKQLRVMVPV